MPAYMITTELKRKYVDVLGRSRLLFERPEGFAQYIDYASYITNGCRKMPDVKVDSVFANLDAAVGEVPEGYYSLEELMDNYIRTSDYYINNIKRIPFWRERDNVLLFLSSIYSAHKAPDNEKVKALVEKLYDCEFDKFKVDNVDVAMLAMMMLGIFPYEGQQSLRSISECKKDASDFLDIFISKYSKFEDVVVLENMKSLPEDDPKLTRLYLFNVFSAVLSAVECAKTMTGADLDYRAYNVEGVWKGGSEKDVYYEFTLNKNCSYNFIIYTLVPLLKTFTYKLYYSWFCFDEKLGCPVLSLLHPMASCHIAMGEKFKSSDVTSFKFVLNDYSFDNAPEYAVPELLSPKNNTALNCHSLSKLSPEDEGKFYDDIQSWKGSNDYSQFEAVYHPGTGIYAVTRENIFISDDSIPGMLYRVPKSLDDRLYGINVDDMCGVLKAYKVEPIIGFESLSLYFNISTDEKMAEYGITLVPISIPLDKADL